MLREHSTCTGQYAVLAHSAQCSVDFGHILAFFYNSYTPCCWNAGNTKQQPPLLPTSPVPHPLNPPQRHIPLSQQHLNKSQRGQRWCVPTLQVVINLAGQQPLPRLFWDHFGRGKRGWEQAEGVDAVATIKQSVPVEESRVNVHLVAHAEQMPGYWTVLADLDSRQITKHVPINGCHMQGNTNRCFGYRRYAARSNYTIILLSCYWNVSNCSKNTYHASGLTHQIQGLLPGLCLVQIDFLCCHGDTSSGFHPLQWTLKRHPGPHRCGQTLQPTESLH